MITGLVSEADAERCRKRKSSFIFMPGFPPSPVKRVSGRGVGMAVRANIDQIGGTIDVVHPRPGHERDHQDSATLAIAGPDR